MTSRSIFAISTIIDNYCNEISVVQNLPGPMTPKKRNEIWTTPPYIDNVSYRFNWVSYPHGESKLHIEYYFHTPQDESVTYSHVVEDANQLREFLENKILNS
jgi:hypothetical protein